MATDVQSLLLKIDASTELARRELKKMDGDFDTFTRRSEQAAGSADKAFADFGKAATFAKASIIGFAAGIGIEGVVSFGRAVLSAADDLEAAAEKAGVGVERYQTLKESLRSLEVEGEQVDKIFGRLTDTLGAVQGGTAGEGVIAVLDKMGITTRILNGEIDTTDELLDAIAGSAKNFSSQAEFTAAVIDLVGKKLGVDLANAIKDGGVALKEGEAAFKAAGGVVDAEYIAKLADANETVDRFVANSKAKLLIWSAETILAFERAGQAVTDFFAASANPIGQGGGIKAPAWLDFLNQTAIPFDLADAQTLSPSAKATIQAVMGQNGNLRANGLPGFDAPPAARPARGAVRASVAAPRAVTRATPPGFSPAQLRAGLDRAEAAVPFGELGQPLANLDAISASLDEIQLQAVDLSNVDVLDYEALGLGVALLEDASFSIASAVFGAGNLGDALEDTFRRTGAALLQSGILNLLSSIGGGGGLFSGLNGLFSGRGFANGGNPPVGRFSLVGERGPELFMPRVPGTIIPNHMLGGGRGGGGDAQSVQVQVDASPLLIATVVGAATQAAQGSAAEQNRRATRPRLPGGLG